MLMPTITRTLFSLILTFVVLAVEPKLIALTKAGISIDGAWLRKRSPGPYLLDQPNATYTLTTDVHTKGTAFLVAAADVTLDLNGHEVVYGDSDPVVVPNGGFEEGSGTTVPGWDLSGAPNARLAPN